LDLGNYLVLFELKMNWEESTKAKNASFEASDDPSLVGIAEMRKKIS